MAGILSFRMKGVKEAIRKTKRLAPAMGKAARVGVKKWAEGTMTESKKECPVMDGVLVNSGTVTMHDKDIHATLSYGGPAEAYAVVQHERLDFKHARGKKAKYLEDPVMRRASKLLPMVQAELKKVK
jgi:hypothetical protein